MDLLCFTMILQYFMVFFKFIFLFELNKMLSLSFFYETKQQQQKKLIFILYALI